MHLYITTDVKVIGNVPKKPNPEVQIENIEQPSDRISVEKYEHDLVFEEITRLEALSNTVKKFGLTRSLLSFVNHDGSLSEAIPEIPTIEKFVADRSAKNSTFAVEAIDNKIVELREKTAAFVETDATSLILNDTIMFNSLKKDHKDLTALLSSIKKYGLTRSLVSFADHDKNLSSFIPQIPSIESLDSDRSVKQSNDAIVAVEAKIATLISFIKQSLKDKIANTFKRGKITLSVNVTKAIAKMDTLHTVLSKNELVFDEKASEAKKIIAPHFDELMHVMNLMIQMSEILTNITEIKLPESKEEYVKWTEGVFEKIKPVHDVLYFFMPSPDKLPVRNNNSIYQKKYPSETLKELGYTGFDKFNTILAEMKKVFSTYHSFYEDMERAYNNSKLVSEHPDEQVLDDAALTLYDLYQSVDEATFWLREYGVVVLKAIFWCSDKKKD